MKFTHIRQPSSCNGGMMFEITTPKGQYITVIITDEEYKQIKNDRDKIIEVVTQKAEKFYLGRYEFEKPLIYDD